MVTLPHGSLIGAHAIGSIENAAASDLERFVVGGQAG
jgi:hypothetical protein